MANFLPLLIALAFVRYAILHQARLRPAFALFGPGYCSIHVNQALCSRCGGCVRCGNGTTGCPVCG